MNCFSIFLGLIFEDSKSGKTRRPKGLIVLGLRSLVGWLVVLG